MRNLRTLWWFEFKKMRFFLLALGAFLLVFMLWNFKGTGVDSGTIDIQLESQNSSYTFKTDDKSEMGDFALTLFRQSGLAFGALFFSSVFFLIALYFLFRESRSKMLETWLMTPLSPYKRTFSQFLFYLVIAHACIFLPAIIEPFLVPEANDQMVTGRFALLNVLFFYTWAYYVPLLALLFLFVACTSSYQLSGRTWVSSIALGLGGIALFSELVSLLGRHREGYFGDLELFRASGAIAGTVTEVEPFTVPFDFALAGVIFTLVALLLSGRVNQDVEV